MKIFLLNKKSLVSTLSLIMLASCAKPISKDSGADSSVTNSGIINGKEVTTSDDSEIRRSTVSLIGVSSSGQVSACSATLIKKHYLLTARHCFTSSIEDSAKPDEKSKYFAIFSNKSVSFKQLSNDYFKKFLTNQAENILTFSMKNVILNKEHDIAIVTLDQTTKIPADYISADLFSSENAPLPNTEVIIAGYGVRLADFSKESTDESPYGFKYGELFQTSGKVTGYGHFNEEKDDEISDGQQPAASTDQIQVLGENSSSTCHGDSGGPTYIKVDGKYQVIGVTSWGSPLFNANGKPIPGSCDPTTPDRQVYVGAALIKSWLQSILN